MAWSREKWREVHKAWREKNKDKLKARRMAKRDEINAKSRAYRAKNKVFINAKQRLWRKQNKAKSRRNDRKNLLKNSYGMSLREFQTLSRHQGGLCAICDSKPKTLSVDHNHSTHKVRGLLCRPCNSALGLFKDNPNFLRHAIAYLKNSSDFGDGILGKLPDLNVSKSGVVYGRPSKPFSPGLTGKLNKRSGERIQASLFPIQAHG